MKKKYYPIGLDIRRKKCVVVGSGNVAQRKIKRLQQYGAKILVINPYEKRCLKGAYLVFACTDNLSLNKRIANDAIEAGVLVNVANPGRASSFILPAIAEKTVLPYRFLPMVNIPKWQRGSVKRLRRLRRTDAVRSLARETRVHPDDLVMPYFVVSGRNKKEPVKSMPGIYRFSVDNLVRDVAQVGVRSVLLFGVKEKSIVPKAVRALRREIKNLVIFTDVCLCAYNPTGHCCTGDNDKTIKVLAQMSVSHAGAGADFVGPSAMMDGQVGAIREALDKKGFKDTGILAYSAKYASSFYGPFREALDSAPRFGDRKDYQMDYCNAAEALREVEQDINEGADIVMVKPALAYLDVIYRVKQRFNIPVAAFNVSGEYALFNDQRSETRVQLIHETLTAIKRAGADIIITYHAKEFINGAGIPRPDVTSGRG